MPVRSDRLCRLLLMGIILSEVILAAPQWRKGCAVLNLYDTQAFTRGRKIAVGVFEVGGGGVGSNAGPLEKPRQILLDQLQKDLKKAKDFSDVSTVAADMATDADYILEGDLVGVNGGSRFGRLFMTNFGNVGQMRITGRILGPASRAGEGDSRGVLSDWECNVFDAGTWGVEGNERIIRHSAKLVSDQLTQQVAGLLRGKEGKTKIDKMEAKAESDSDKSPITGKTHSTNRSWRDKPEWNISDYDNEIESFVVRSREERSRGVDVLWLTQASYRAHEKVIPNLKQTAILEKKEIKPGMLTDLEPVKAFVGQDVFVLVATFKIHSTAAPFLWDSKQMQSQTFLTVGDGGHRLVPTQFLDNKIAPYMVFNERKVMKGRSYFRAYHPVIIVFPARRTDGTPFIRNTGDVVEFHTSVDGRPVKIVFSLSDFDLKTTEELKIHKTS